MPALSTHDIKLFYSTHSTPEVGTPADEETWIPAANYLGGPRTLTELSNDYLHNFLNKTIRKQQISGITKFRCGYFFNNSLTDYIKNPILIVVANTSSPSDLVRVGWGTSKIGSGLAGALDGSIEQQITDEYTFPQNVSFFDSNIRNEGAILNADIPPQKGKAFWIMYNSTFNAQDYAYNNFRIRLLADNLYNDVIPPTGVTIPPKIEIPIIGECSGDFDFQKIMKAIFARFPDFICTVGNNNVNSDPNIFTTSIQSWIKKMLLCFGNKDVVTPTVRNHYYSKIIQNDFVPKTSKKYYGKTFGNIHICVMDTSGETPYTKPSDQYNYVEGDLKNAVSDPDVDWIIVMTNRPMYASQTTSEDRYLFADLRDTYHNLLTETQVCQVWQGGMHWYERSKVLGYNSGNPTLPVSFDYDYVENDPEPTNNFIYRIQNRKSFPDGQVYFCIGTGGASHDVITSIAPYSLKRNYIDFGYADIIVDNTEQYKKLITRFFSTGRQLQQNMDQFIIERTL